MQNFLIPILDRILQLIPLIKTREQLYALGMLVIASLLGFWLYLYSITPHISISPMDEQTLTRLQSSLQADRIVVWEYSGSQLSAIWDSYSSEDKAQASAIPFQSLRKIKAALDNGDCTSVLIGEASPPAKKDAIERDYIGYCPINSDQAIEPIGAISAETKIIPNTDYEGDWLTVLWQAGRSVLRN